MAVILGALAFVAFLVAAILSWRGRNVPTAFVALGLALLVLTVSVPIPPEPPEPPTPTPTTDFGGYRPHYQGHGTTTPGGRGGEIRRVSTAAALAEAVKARPGCANTPQSCARVILFDTSGNYQVAGGQLTIDSPYLTLAGQTAPDDGVTLVNTRLMVDTHDVVVQHVRVRLPPQLLNACSIGDAGDGGDNSHVANVVLDHLTCSWSKETNNLLVARPGSHDIALLDSIVAEGLWPNGWGGIGAGVGYKNTVARNLFSQHWSRQPIWGAPAELALYNNVSYNGTDNSPGYSALPAFYGDADGESDSAGAEQTVIMNNVLIAGPNSGGAHAILGLSKKQQSIAAGSKIYLEGNQGSVSRSADQWGATICTGSYGTYQNAATCGPGSNMRSDVLFDWWTATHYQVLPTSEVLTSVLDNAGARPLNRDAADLRMIADVRNGTGTHFLDTGNVSLPELRVTTRVCALPSDPHGAGTRTLSDGTRNTRLEDWLESDAVCGSQRLEPATSQRGQPRRFP